MMLFMCMCACLHTLQSPTLEELYLSVDNLFGRLPDTVPRNSSLKAFLAIGPSEQRRGQTNPGFTGPIPRSLLASKALQYLVSTLEAR